MAAKWRLTGDYFENCNCDVVCPCLISAAAPLTGVRAQGSCDVALAFHIERGEYDGAPLDGLTSWSPPMCRGPWRTATGPGRLHRPARRRPASRRPEAIFGGAEGGPMAAFAPLVGTHLGVRRAPITYTVQGKNSLGGNPQRLAHVGRPAADDAPGRGDLGLGRPPRGAGPARPRSRRRGQHLRRPRHALGQFGPQRPLRSNQLVRRLVTQLPSPAQGAAGRRPVGAGQAPLAVQRNLILGLLLALAAAAWILMAQHARDGAMGGAEMGVPRPPWACAHRCSLRSGL